MTAYDPLPQVKSPLYRQMVLILSGIIVGLVLLVGIPLAFISINLQRQVVAGEHQDITDRTAQNLSDILQGLETNQLPMASAESINPATASLANQVITLLNLTTSRVSAQLQTIAAENGSLEQLLTINSQVRGLKRFTLESRQVQESYWRDEPLAADNIRPTDASLALTAQGIVTQDAFLFDRTVKPVLVIATRWSDGA
jgi:hypothetical protein